MYSVNVFFANMLTDYERKNSLSPLVFAYNLYLQTDFYVD